MRLSGSTRPAATATAAGDLALYVFTGCVASAAAANHRDPLHDAESCDLRRDVSRIKG